MSAPPRPRAIVALVAFFAFGTLAGGVAALTLALPGTALDVVWRLKPEEHARLATTGALSVLLMCAVSAACAAAAVGVWRGRRWAWWLAIALIAANLVGDAANAVLRGDLRTLVGLPIGGALLAWLVFGRARAWFR